MERSTASVSGGGPSYEQVLEVALQRLDEGQPLDSAGLLERFPGAERVVEQVLGAIARYERFAREDRERRGGERPAEVLAGGTELGDYRIVELLGQGGMGVVYRARQRSLDGREVALKVLRGSLAARDPRFLARFRREASLASRVHDEHVAEVYDYGEHEGQPYFTMQLVEGRGLSEVLEGLVRLQRRGWSEHTRGEFVRQVVRLVRDLASGLAAIHSAGLVHRDVKPSNVILDGAGEDDMGALNARPVLVDFGLVRATEGSDLTGSLTRLGSPAYTSPEGMLGRRQGPRADVFSLGALLHDLLAVTGAGSRGPASSGLCGVRALNAGVDERLAAIVRMALEERAELRYEDGGALRDELDSYLTNDPIRALPTSRVGRLRLWGRRDPLRAVKLFAGSGALVTGLFVLSWGGAKALPLYAATSAAIAAERSGDLASASRLYGEVYAGRALAGWLPGLADDARRAGGYWEPNGLSRVFEWLDSGSESDVTLAHNELQRRLLDPSLEPDVERLMGFLVRELEVGDEGRKLGAATTAGQYLLVHPLPYCGDESRGGWAERLEAALLGVVEGIDAETAPGELQYHAICALSGLGRLEPFRQLVPLIAHPDVETRRLAAAATERLWLSSWEGAEDGGFPLEWLCVWAGSLWENGEAYDVALSCGEVPEGWTRAANRKVHKFFETQVGHALDTVAWGLHWEALSSRLDNTPEWLALPPGLRRHLSVRSGLFVSFLGDEPPSTEDMPGLLTVWPASGVALSYEAPFNCCIRWPRKSLLQLVRAKEDYVWFDNLWAPSDEEGEIHVQNEGEPKPDISAVFDLNRKPPGLAGRALELKVTQACQVPQNPAGTQHPPNEELTLVLRRPVKDQVSMRIEVPEGASRAFITIKGAPAIRGPLPHLGQSRVRLSTRDGHFAIEWDSTAVLGTPREFLINEQTLSGSDELELQMELLSTTNQYWLHTVTVRFEATGAK